MATFITLLFTSFFSFEIESYYLPLAGLEFNYVDQDLRLTKVPLPHQYWCKRHVDNATLSLSLSCFVFEIRSQSYGQAGLELAM